MSSSVPSDSPRWLTQWGHLTGAVVVVLIVVITMVVIVSGPETGARRWRDTSAAPSMTQATRPASASTPNRQERGPAPLVPTTATPLRVLEIGDSLGIDLGYQLQSQLDATGMARTTVASVGDSGLSNVTYLDWPAHLAGLLTTDRPQIVVVFIGANDDQGLTVNGVAAAPGTPGWVEGYAGRVDEVLREATSAGARVVWIGMPPMANPSLDAAMQRRERDLRTRECDLLGDALRLVHLGVQRSRRLWHRRRRPVRSTGRPSNARRRPPDAGRSRRAGAHCDRRRHPGLASFPRGAPVAFHRLLRWLRSSSPGGMTITFGCVRSIDPRPTIARGTHDRGPDTNPVGPDPERGRAPSPR